MIIGIGHDLCNIDRIARIHAQFGERFERRICTPAECAECAQRADKPAYLAKRFAAKEAVFKALHMGDQKKMFWHDAEILSTQHAHGAPQLSLHGGCLEAVKQLIPDDYLSSFHISLSDDIPFASAFVVIEAVHKNQA